MTDKIKMHIYQENEDFRDTLVAIVSFLEKSDVPIEKAYEVCTRIQSIIARLINEKTTKKEKKLILSGSFQNNEWCKLYLVLDYYEFSYITQLQLLYLIHELAKIAVEISDEQKKSD